MKTTLVAILTCCALTTFGCSEDESTSGPGGSFLDAGHEAEAAVDAPFPDVVQEADAGEDVAMLPRPSVDGLFDEWGEADKLAEDPQGDGTSVFDVTSVWATSRGTDLYVRVKVGLEPHNMQAGWPGETALRFEIGLPGNRGLSVDLREHTVTVDSEALRWSEVGFQIAPTTASTEVEIKLELGALGVVQGDTVTLDFSGSDALASPVPYVLKHDAMEPERRDPGRAAGTWFRIASLNVEWDGLVEPGRAEPMGRLLHAAAADIFCLQEVWNTEAAEIASRLSEIDPHGDGAVWNVHRTGDTAIATRAALTPLPHNHFTNPPFTGAGIELGDGSRVMVFTVRPTCCGFIGNPADQQRIGEFQRLVSTIVALRDGTLGTEFESFVKSPVIVFGDWNLVGSTTPLDLMLDPSGPGLERWLLRHLVGDGAIYTWRNDDLGSFAPGALDVLAYGSVDPASTLEPISGYVLDTEQLDGAMLEQLGLQGSDSLSTDHLLLVADFGK